MGRAFDQHRVLHPAGMVIVGMAAVFGGAVQVPICHAIAGCRNDGSYELHSASSIAYTGPKSEWVDSPAHLAESVQIAIRTLDSGNRAGLRASPTCASQCCCDQGLALDRAEGPQLIVGSLRSESRGCASRSSLVRPVNSRSRPESAARTYFCLAPTPPCNPAIAC